MQYETDTVLDYVWVTYNIDSVRQIKQDFPDLEGSLVKTFTQAQNVKIEAVHVDFNNALGAVNQITITEIDKDSYRPNKNAAKIIIRREQDNVYNFTVTENRQESAPKPITELSDEHLTMIKTLQNRMFSPEWRQYDFMALKQFHERYGGDIQIMVEAMIQQSGKEMIENDKSHIEYNTYPDRDFQNRDHLVAQLQMTGID